MTVPGPHLVGYRRIILLLELVEGDTYMLLDWSRVNVTGADPMSLGGRAVFRELRFKTDIDDSLSVDASGEWFNSREIGGAAPVWTGEAIITVVVTVGAGYWQTRSVKVEQPSTRVHVVNGVSHSDVTVQNPEHPSLPPQLVEGVGQFGYMSMVQQQRLFSF